jgi:hypothetical protein
MTCVAEICAPIQTSGARLVDADGDDARTGGSYDRARSRAASACSARVRITAQRPLVFIS